MRICLFIGLSGCGFISETELLARFDQDGDGFEAVRFGGEDCDDDDRDVHPDALEVCDGQDNDCDGDVDSTALDRRTWYRDLDQDGYGSPSTETPAVSCYPPDGFVGDATDCNDDPEADGANIHPQTVWYLDDDGDGYGDPDHTRVTCIQLPGLVDNDEDCDDTDPSLSPETVWWEDADGDGFGNPETGITSCIEHSGSTRADPAFADCEDDDEQVFPGAAIAEPELCTRDADGDGFGALDVGGDAEPGTDCDDERASVYPGATQDWTDDIDNDCDGQVNVVDDSLADCTLLGGSAGDGLGAALASPGDLNGDGQPDLLIGVPGESTFSPSNGAALVLLSPLGCADAEGGGLIRIVGAEGMNRIGASLAGAGDVNGDGLADFMVGSQDDVGYIVFGDDDAVSPGGATELLLSDGGRSFLSHTGYQAERDGDMLGKAVAGLGHFTGDGDPDVVFGAYLADGAGLRSGRVYVFSQPDRIGWVDLSIVVRFDDPTQPPTWIIDAELGGTSDYFGYSVAGLGDVDGDGIDDMAIGAPGQDERGSSAGAVYLIPGVDRPLAYEDAWGVDVVPPLPGEEETEEPAVGLDEGGGHPPEEDTGESDAPISSGGHKMGGGAGKFEHWDTGVTDGGGVDTGIDPLDSHVLQAGTMVMPVDGFTRLLGEVAGDRAGATLAPAGDVNGDGYLDVVVGGTATGSIEQPGRVFVWFGTAASLLPATHVLSDSGLILRLGPERGNGNLGSAIAAAGPLQSTGVAGDLNGDGFGDLLVSAPSVDDAFLDGGEVVLVFGMAEGGDYVIGGSSSHGAVFRGSSLSRLGQSVASPGDLTGDGSLDLVFGTPGTSTAGTSAGAALLFSSAW